VESVALVAPPSAASAVEPPNGENSRRL